MLTRLQRRMLDYLVAYTREHGISPSFAEIRDHMGLKSKSGVFRVLDGLEGRGFITRLRGRARAIEILRDPSTIGVPSALPQERLADIVRAGHFYHNDQLYTVQRK